MPDFVNVIQQSPRKDVVEFSPEYNALRKTDLMIQGGKFLAVWDPSNGNWSTNMYRLMEIIDEEVLKAKNEYSGNDISKAKLISKSSSGELSKLLKWLGDLPDDFKALDEKLVFLNDPVNKKDYSTKRLSYDLSTEDCPAFKELMSVLYSEEERRKIFYAIGAIVTGASKKMQKFYVLFGPPGSGKSTVLGIIHDMFEEFSTAFNAKVLGSSSNQFPFEAFKNHPLIAIQHDGDLSKIEDNTNLNSLVSHEFVLVNTKNKSPYVDKFHTLLFMGTNKPVKITDSKSGLLRRLIDIRPTGNTIPVNKYDILLNQIRMEYGAIANYCKEVYLENPKYYDKYVPKDMMSSTNDFYNYILDNYELLSKPAGVSLDVAWTAYNNWCDECKVPYPLSKRLIKDELKSYFESYNERVMIEGVTYRNWYKGFKDVDFNKKKEVNTPTYTIIFNEFKSLLDELYADCPAQEATKDETPKTGWDNVKTTLKDIDTTKCHYVRPPENHIVIDFDIHGEDGSKSFELNLKEASKWPPTYAELSKSGAGIHLHYIYTGDVRELEKVYAKDIEIKVFTGKSALRRKLTKCNDLPIATISSGLPRKEVKDVLNSYEIEDDKHLISSIKAMIRKKKEEPNWMPTVQIVSMIKSDLDKAYESGMHYDVTTLRNAIFNFAQSSTNSKEKATKLVMEMKFKSDDISEPIGENAELPIAFYDVEVFPNLFLVNYKILDVDGVIRMINPSPEEIDIMTKRYRLVGFNCRRYDNHIMYARILGYSNASLYDLSKRIVSGDKTAFFGNAYNLSYTDIYDYAAKKQSLKKWEIELGIHHQELGFKWDKEVPEDKWEEVAAYCDNDVIATEAVWNATKADFTARLILADVAGKTPNDTTNSLTTAIIFGTEKNPDLNYRFIGDESDICDLVPFVGDIDYPQYFKWDSHGQPIFPGYSFDAGKSLYRDEDPKEGGYVYAEPGIYYDVALLDIASMHPSSIIAEHLFGIYTKRFEDIKNARVHIKRKEFDACRDMLDGKLAKYLDDPSIAKDLAQALKIAINSVYGLTSASFANPFKDNRNKDNIVAKRGALFMINLKHEVQAKGYTVAHIKTDSIKIPNADEYIIKFVQDYGRAYGYDFEHEDTYEKLCLVNDAVYIAKAKDGHWTATGTQFQVPYIFKTLFSKEELEFKDFCEAKSVTQGELYLDMNENLGDEHNYIFVGRVGEFCPIKEGKGGGVLYRCKDDKYYAAAGTKGYRWLESEVVKNLHLEGDIDMNYYENMATEAIDTINKYGSFEEFAEVEPPFK